MAKNAKGHITAVITVIIWGTTFISTKILLADFTPIEILIVRFVLGLVTLAVIYPKPLKTKGIKQEIIFALAGLSGVCLYYLLENTALTFSLASNVGIITSIAPLFTALLSYFLIKSNEKLGKNFYIGFVVAIVGIALISFNGSKLQLNPLGDVLAVLAALAWAIYSLLTKKISGFGYNIIQSTRRIFVYGILFMIPAIFIFDFI